MAGDPAQHTATSDDGTPPKIDMDEHRATYEGFLSVTKWGVIIVIILLVGMLIFLV